MAREWMSLAHAASVLGMSVKTLHLRIEELGYETRIRNGKRYVAIDVDAAPGGGGTAVATRSAEPGCEPADSEETMLARREAKRQLARLAETRASLHQKELVRTHEQQMKVAKGAIAGWQQAAKQAHDLGEQQKQAVGHARRQSTFALTLSAAVFVLLATIGIWATYAVTRTKASLAHEQQRLASEQRLTDAYGTALDDTRSRLERTEAQLMEMKSHLDDAREYAVEMAKIAAAAEREAKVLREHPQR